jgi:hypothetical protein
MKLINKMNIREEVSNMVLEKVQIDEYTINR